MRRAGKTKSAPRKPHPAAATYDFIVVGSGIAGLSFALRAAEHGRVLVLTKKLSWAGSTNLAQGGIASVMDPADSLEDHVRDTLVAGAGLCRKDRVRALVERGPGAIRDLVEWGVRFTRASSGGSGRSGAPATPFHLAREGGHSSHRIVHADDLTGHEIQRALIEAARAHRNLTILEDHMAIDLVTAKHLKAGEREAGPRRCHGLYALDVRKNRIGLFLGAATVLCTGGVGQVYSHTTNDSVSTGDGIAMAYRAGAAVEDLEFMQFHPTSLYNPGHPTYLISEALRGHGGVLRNHLGEPFMDGVHPMRSLAPRDIVARAIDAEMKRTGHPCVYLDMTAFTRRDLRRHFPNIVRHCRGIGLDIAKDRIPVVPAAHFMCGGVKVDGDSATGIAGLYAVGETACTGVHGANRLASNSLLEGVVFAERALSRILASPLARPSRNRFKDWNSLALKPAPETIIYSHALETIRSTMWHYVGIVRSDFRLARAREFIRVISRQIEHDYWSFSMVPDLIELRNLTLCAELIIRGAIRRKESRGLHYNLDYPAARGKARHITLRLGPE
ncbi:MAG TPA: L-aspartate oxidase [Fibrobacteria bacterium]|nr:L-aspartate oxidase [Fibrobacteria bacterium]